MIIFSYDLMFNIIEFKKAFWLAILDVLVMLRLLVIIN